jgi:protein-S-isoprenylcysteine O-methyltransferase Ste14
MPVMSNSSQDHPNVIIFPPIILATTVALGCILQWFWPIGLLTSMGQAWRIPVGAGVFLAGVLLAATGRRAMVRLRTNVSPLLPTTALATDGIFRWTRNPLYSGGTLMMLGVAFVFALDWLLLLILPSVLILHFGVVRREEDYLERKFGDQYRHYKASVARYGFGI